MSDWLALRFFIITIALRNIRISISLCKKNQTNTKNQINARKQITLEELMKQREPAVFSRLSHPVEVAGVPVLAVRRQVLAQPGSLSDHQECDGHEERQ